MFPDLIYDPGILTSILRHAVPYSAKQTSVIVPGHIILVTTTLSMSRVLFDSGALQANYIDQTFVDSYPHLFTSITSHVPHTVRLGDNKTLVPLHRIVTVTVSFLDSHDISHTDTIECSVLDMPGTQMIVGLPSILTTFFDFFVDLLHQARDSRLLDSSSLNTFNPLPDNSDCLNPWTTPPYPDAIEEIESYEPCSFTAPLAAMDSTHNTKIEEYYALLESHIAPEFLAAIPTLLEYMKSPTVVSVFVPKVWTGITGIDPVELEFSPDLPKSMKPKARNINPKLEAIAKQEFIHLCDIGYFVPSKSPIASCLVIAPKKGPAMIRLCIDFRPINPFITVPRFHIPNVPIAIQKAAKSRYFCDLDWRTAFHQIRLGPITQANLSVVTPWGLVQPQFLPEGVAPASGILQSIVLDLFSDFSDFTIAIFDNLLILADSYDDCFEKLQKIITRCHERNVILNFSKTYLALQEVTFFGYLVSQGKHEMSPERKEAIHSMVMPTNLKAMQRFLGSALFFKGFLPHYSDLTAQLNDMTKDKFDWNISTWKIDYTALFTAFKIALANSVAVYFPDYDLQWVLRCDASNAACASVLIQITADCVEQPIAFQSHKFTSSALFWPINKKVLRHLFSSINTLFPITS